MYNKNFQTLLGKNSILIIIPSLPEKSKKIRPIFFDQKLWPKFFDTDFFLFFCFWPPFVCWSFSTTTKIWTQKNWTTTILTKKFWSEKCVTQNFDQKFFTRISKNFYFWPRFFFFKYNLIVVDNLRN